MRARSTGAIFGLAFLAVRVAASDPLPDAIGSVLKRNSLDGSGLSIHVQELTSRSEILSYRADTPRNPASTMKIVTTLAALEMLTPSYRWSTQLYATRPPAEGRIDGDVYFVGGGDPYLVEERVWLLTQSLWRLGIRAVDGDIVVDDSFFAPIDEDPAAFDNQPHRTYNVVPSAALVNFNTVRFVFEPKPDSKGVAIRTEPALASLKIDNRLRTAPASCRGYRRGISMTVERPGDVRFDGVFPTRCRSYAFDRSVMPAHVFTGTVFQAQWQAAGGQWDGGVRAGRLADDAYFLLEFDSVSLGETVRLMNKFSNNLIARHLLLTLGAEVYGRPATEKKGIRVLRDWLSSAAIEAPGLVLENGAGRSRRARISARALVDVIAAGWRSAYMPEFFASLALLGQDGTLSERLKGSSLAGRSHFKTGRLDHVLGIAGIQQNPDGHRYAVVVLHNAKNVHRGAGEAVQNAVIQWLSAYTPSRDLAIENSPTRAGTPPGD